MADSISVHFTKSDHVIHIQFVSYIVIINIQSNWFTKKYKPRQYLLEINNFLSTIVVSLRVAKLTKSQSNYQKYQK